MPNRTSGHVWGLAEYLQSWFMENFYQNNHPGLSATPVYPIIMVESLNRGSTANRDESIQYEKVATLGYNTAWRITSADLHLILPANTNDPCNCLTYGDSFFTWVPGPTAFFPGAGCDDGIGCPPGFHCGDYVIIFPGLPANLCFLTVELPRYTDRVLDAGWQYVTALREITATSPTGQDIMAALLDVHAPDALTYDIAGFPLSPYGSESSRCLSDMFYQDHTL